VGFLFAPFGKGAAILRIYKMTEGLGIELLAFGHGIGGIVRKEEIINGRLLGKEAFCILAGDLNRDVAEGSDGF
jgi:hypothetical protein